MAENSLKARALRLLSMREHSVVELQRKLAGSGSADNSSEDIAQVLNYLQELGLLSDERFAHAYVRAHSRRLGRLRLRNELRQRGIHDDLVSAALEQECGDSEMARLQALWRQKFGVLPQNPKEWAKQARFLQGRGFSAELIRKLLKDPFDESA